MKVSLKAITPDIEKFIVEVARVSSSRKDKTAEPEGLINYLIRNKHWSPFEHGFLTFEVETSKAIAVQLLRHRSNYFQEFSQRYQDVKKVSDNSMFEDIEIRLQETNNRQSSSTVLGEIQFNGGSSKVSITPEVSSPEVMFAIEKMRKAIKLSEEAYNEALEVGIAREVARFVLPMVTKTKLYITMNVRSLIHWLDLRDDGHAQKEVQLLAKEVKKIAMKELPLISKAIRWKQ